MHHVITCIVLVLSFSLAAFAEEKSSSFSLSSSPTVSNRSGIALSPAYADQSVDSSYVLGPGDFLDLVLENNYVTVQVYPDGSVAIEECGAVNVGGKTLAEARQLILDLVSRRYKREYCYVQLAALKKFRINAMGAVSQVGQHLVESQTRLSFFIRQIGGLVSNANTEDIWVIRANDTLHIDYNAMSARGDFSSDIMLEQGDKIFVPFVAVGDNVVLIFPDSRTSVAYQDGRTLQDYFNLAGGSRKDNLGYKSVCVREPGKPTRWITMSEMKLTKVAPNTEVEIPFKKWLYT